MKVVAFWMFDITGHSNNYRIMNSLTPLKARFTQTQTADGIPENPSRDLVCKVTFLQLQYLTSHLFGVSEV
jgi:hypothetical protein